MAAILDLSNMAATEGAHLGSLEKLVGDGYIPPWSENGACGTIWTIIWLSPLTNTIPSIYKLYITPPWHGALPGKCGGNTSMRLRVTVRKRNMTDRQTDGGGGWGGAYQYLPSRAFGAAGDKIMISLMGHMDMLSSGLYYVSVINTSQDSFTTARNRIQNCSMLHQHNARDLNRVWKYLVLYTCMYQSHRTNT